MRTLLPRVYGQTAQAEQKKSAGRGQSRTWDEGAFFAKLAERKYADDIKVARALFDWSSRRMTRIEYGSGAKNGSFLPAIYFADRSWFGPFRVYTGYTGAYVEIPFAGPAWKSPPFDSDAMKLEVIRRLNSIPGVEIAEDLNRWPTIYP